MRHASLFSGIGGPEVAAAMLGWENVFHCEINPFGRRILEYWFPNSDSYDDIKTTDFSKYRGRVDVLTGGFPCQPFSYSGRRRGADDDRYLWPQMLRVIAEVRPTWVIGENVAGIVSMVEPGKVSPMASQTSLFDEGDGVQRYRQEQSFTIERVCRDLEGLGYAVQPILVPACAIGAPHRRDRVFIIANVNSCSNMRTAREDDGTSETQRIQERHEIREPDIADNVRSKDAAVSQNTLHGRQLHRPNEEQGGERHIGDAGSGSDERLRRETSRTYTANSECLRLQHDLDGRSETGVLGTEKTRGQNCIPEQVQRLETNGRGRTSPDPDGNRGREIHEHLQPRLTDGSEPECACGQRDATNTASERRGELRDKGEKERPCGCYDLLGICCGLSYEVGERWANFPSVSPIHRGNDGLPFPLDDLTISWGKNDVKKRSKKLAKWRTESLKAYGNAIVPQVMYEIFRAIEIISQQ
ncbi:MAG: DNA cytosine methyltransferase [Bacteroidales bacterium]|nr:DNA cytosine methyltransferase [Bacteroidales bacterium]